MRLIDLRRRSAEQCRKDYAAGKITRFELLFRDFLSGEIDWPAYPSERIVALRHRMNLTQEALARLLKVTKQTVVRWETQAVELTGPAAIALCLLDKTEDGIFELMTEEGHFAFKRIDGKDGAVRRTGALADALRERLEKRQEPPPEPFDAAAVTELRERMRMSRREFAKFLDVSPSTIDKWEQGSVAVKGVALKFLRNEWEKQ